MQIEIKIDSTCKDPRIIVLTDKMTEEINALVKKLSEETPQMLAGFREDTLEILEPTDIIRIYAADGKVFALTNQGYYSPCVPALVDVMGNEINAVMLQTLLSGVLGAAFAASSVIWEMENWSIAKQTGIYFLITSIVMMPIAYFTNWMEHSLLGFISYFSVFLVIFAVVWFIQYRIWKSSITKINSKL